MESQLSRVRSVLKQLLNEYSSRRAYWYIIRSDDSDLCSLCGLFGVESDVLVKAFIAAGFLKGRIFKRDKFKDWIALMEDVEYDAVHIGAYKKKDVHVLRVGAFEEKFCFSAREQFNPSSKAMANQEHYQLLKKPRIARNNITRSLSKQLEELVDDDYLSTEEEEEDDASANQLLDALDTTINHFAQ